MNTPADKNRVYNLLRKLTEVTAYSKPITGVTLIEIEDKPITGVKLMEIKPKPITGVTTLLEIEDKPIKAERKPTPKKQYGPKPNNKYACHYPDSPYYILPEGLKIGTDAWGNPIYWK